MGCWDCQTLALGPDQRSKRAQPLQVRHMPTIHLPKSSYPGLSDLVVPPISGKHVEMSSWTGPHEEQPPKAPPSLQHKGDECVFDDYLNRHRLHPLCLGAWF